MNEKFEGWRVTALCRPEYSFGHNLRLPDFVENQKHIDSTRPHKVLLHLGNERECYEKVFLLFKYFTFIFYLVFL